MTTYWFKGEGLARKKGVVFLRWGEGGIDTPMHIMSIEIPCAI